MQHVKYAENYGVSQSAMGLYAISATSNDYAFCLILSNHLIQKSMVLQLSWIKRVYFILSYSEMRKIINDSYVALIEI
jgi:hypothetical protein